VVGDPACEAMLEELRLKGIDTSDFGVFTNLRQHRSTTAAQRRSCSGGFPNYKTRWRKKGSSGT
jgi:hypothetical protein